MSNYFVEEVGGCIGFFLNSFVKEMISWYLKIRSKLVYGEEGGNSFSEVVYICFFVKIICL